MKKILYLSAALVLCLAILTACGGVSGPDVENSFVQTESASPSPSADTMPPDYGKMIDDYTASFATVMEEVVGTLARSAKHLSGNESMAAWGQSFMEAKEMVDESAETLQAIATGLPEELQETYIQITVATAAVRNAMTDFESYAKAAVDGETKGFEENIGGFLSSLGAAETLWAEAVK